MQEGIILHFNDHLGYGYILNNKEDLIFFHFSDIICEGIKTCNIGDTVTFEIDLGTSYLREKKAINCHINTISKNVINIIKDQNVSQNQLLEYFDNNKLVIFHNTTFNNIDFQNNTFAQKVIFFSDCNFVENCLFLNCNFYSSIFFCGCTFQSHFSLKQSVFGNDIHMESSRIVSKTGASFRGVKCKNIYLDFSFEGGKDMLWFNEVTIDKNLVIGGSFKNDVQILGLHENKVGKIGSLFIGKEYFANQRINSSQFKKSLDIQNMNITEGIYVENTDFNNININNSITKYLSITSSKIEDTIELEKVNLINDKFSLIFNRNLTLNRFNIKKCTFNGLVNLDDSSVEKSIIFQDSIFNTNSSLSVYNFLTNSFRLSPSNLIYKKKRHFFFNPKFHLLSKESTAFQKNKEVKEKLAYEYSSFRKWFHDNGDNTQEDDAYFNMREYSNVPWIFKIIFGYIFGWGVKLGYIFISSFSIILLFSVLYSLTGIPIPGNIIFSLQSFFASILGEWDKYGIISPLGIIPILSIIETAIGIIFITALAGAYMRKILR